MPSFDFIINHPGSRLSAHFERGDPNDRLELDRYLGKLSIYAIIDNIKYHWDGQVVHKKDITIQDKISGFYRTICDEHCGPESSVDSPTQNVENGLVRMLAKQREAFCHDAERAMSLRKMRVIRIRRMRAIIKKEWRIIQLRRAVLAPGQIKTTYNTRVLFSVSTALRRHRNGELKSRDLIKVGHPLTFVTVIDGNVIMGNAAYPGFDGYGQWRVRDAAIEECRAVSSSDVVPHTVAVNELAELKTRLRRDGFFDARCSSEVVSSIQRQLREQQQKELLRDVSGKFTEEWRGIEARLVTLRRRLAVLRKYWLAAFQGCDDVLRRIEKEQAVAVERYVNEVNGYPEMVVEANPDGEGQVCVSTRVEVSGGAIDEMDWCGALQIRARSVLRGLGLVTRDALLNVPADELKQRLERAPNVGRRCVSAILEWRSDIEARGDCVADVT